MKTTDDLALSCARLKFCIEHPPLSDCWLDGHETALMGHPEENNPFAFDTAEHQSWTDGWWAGFYGEDPLFDYNGDILPSLRNPPTMTRVLQNEAAANQPHWSTEDTKVLLARGLKIVGVVLAVLAAYELADIAA